MWADLPCSWLRTAEDRWLRPFWSPSLLVLSAAQGQAGSCASAPSAASIHCSEAASPKQPKAKGWETCRAAEHTLLSSWCSLWGSVPWSHCWHRALLVGKSGMLCSLVIPLPLATKTPLTNQTNSTLNPRWASCSFNLTGNLSLCTWYVQNGWWQLFAVGIPLYTESFLL